MTGIRCLDDTLRY